MGNSSASASVIPVDGDRKIASMGENAATFSIGELSREFGLTLRTLRFYEIRGLISPRYHRSVRVYRQSDRKRLALILKGKKLGFTLKEIQQMLVAQQGGCDPQSFHLSREKCVEQINMLERQKREIETALAELRRSYSEPYVSAFAEREAPDPLPRNGPSMWPSERRSS